MAHSGRAIRNWEQVGGHKKRDREREMRDIDRGAERLRHGGGEEREIDRDRGDGKELVASL